MALRIASTAPTLLIRRAAYEQSGLTRADIDRRFGLTAEEFRVEGDLVAVGPLYEPEAAGELAAELERSGLIYFDDFFELSGSWPDWLQVFGSA